MYEYIGNSLVEYNVPTPAAKPLVIAANLLAIESLLTESYSSNANQMLTTVIKVGFTTPVPIPPGYDTSPNQPDPTKKDPKG